MSSYSGLNNLIFDKSKKYYKIFNTANSIASKLNFYEFEHISYWLSELGEHNNYICDVEIPDDAQILEVNKHDIVADKLCISNIREFNKTEQSPKIIKHIELLGHDGVDIRFEVAI